jgi:hypothetical protein
MAYSVSTDANANIYVSGTTYVSLISGVPINGLSSAFSALYTAIGDAQGFVQFGTGGYNAVTSVAWGANGAFYVTGYTNGNVISGQTGSVFQITYKP